MLLQIFLTLFLLQHAVPLRIFEMFFANYPLHYSDTCPFHLVLEILHEIVFWISNYKQHNYFAHRIQRPIPKIWIQILTFFLQIHPWIWSNCSCTGDEITYKKIREFIARSFTTSVNFRMNLWSHRFSQNTIQILWGFLPCTVPHYRAEILTIFGSYFGRHDDLKNLFWNLLTFSTYHTLVQCEYNQIKPKSAKICSTYLGLT